jgi:hypothetical protein
MVVVGCLAGSGVVRAQTATTVVQVPVPLLPQSFGAWQRDDKAELGEPKFSLVSVSKDALEECGPQRSLTQDYSMKMNGYLRSVHVEAVEFNDATGAYSAFTLAKRPDMKLGKEVGSATAIGDGGVLFETGSSLALVYPATAADIPELARLASAMPKVSGPRSQPPLLPTFFPAKGLVPDSIRYALGPTSYSAEGGTLAARQLGWEKSAEAVTAVYADKRGKETLTLLLYPTPQIAGEHTRALEGQVQGGAKVRREGELVVVAAGTFSADDAQNMIENIHLRTEVTFDKAMPPEFHTEIQKTYSLLQSIAVFSGVGMLAAVLLGAFLGGGRALVRKMQGKDMATDAEFLSLHLDPQNPRPKFDPPAS